MKHLLLAARVLMFSRSQAVLESFQSGYSPRYFSVDDQLARWTAVLFAAMFAGRILVHSWAYPASLEGAVHCAIHVVFAVAGGFLVGLGFLVSTLGRSLGNRVAFFVEAMCLAIAGIIVGELGPLAIPEPGLLFASNWEVEGNPVAMDWRMGLLPDFSLWEPLKDGSFLLCEFFVIALAFSSLRSLTRRGSRYCFVPTVVITVLISGPLLGSMLWWAPPYWAVGTVPGWERRISWSMLLSLLMAAWMVTAIILFTRSIHRSRRLRGEAKAELEKPPAPTA